MTRKVGNSKQHDTSKKTSTTKHHITTNNTMETGGKILNDTPNPNTWYRFMETDGQKWAVFDDNLIPKPFLPNSRLNHLGERTKWNKQGKEGLTTLP